MTIVLRAYSNDFLDHSLLRQRASRAVVPRAGPSTPQQRTQPLTRAVVPRAGLSTPQQRTQPLTRGRAPKKNEGSYIVQDRELMKQLRISQAMLAILVDKPSTRFNLKKIQRQIIRNQALLRRIQGLATFDADAGSDSGSDSGIETLVEAGQERGQRRGQIQFRSPQRGKQSEQRMIRLD